MYIPLKQKGLHPRQCHSSRGDRLRFEQKLGIDMPAQFYCEATFTIPLRRDFILGGRIVEGTVRPGMRATIPLPAGGELVRSIDSVEIISTTDKRGAVGLSIRCEDKEEVESLQQIGIRNEWHEDFP